MAGGGKFKNNKIRKVTGLCNQNNSCQGDIKRDYANIPGIIYAEFKLETIDIMAYYMFSWCSIFKSTT